MITSFFARSRKNKRASPGGKTPDDEESGGGKRSRGAHGALKQKSKLKGAVAASGGGGDDLGEGEGKVEESVESYGDPAKLITLNVSGVDIDINDTWAKVLKSEFKKPYFLALQRFVASERKKHTIYPPPEQVYSAFNLTPRTAVRVVILGQDPYHGPGQAHGLCFSVQKGVRVPPSLRNMIKEAQQDVGISKPDHGSLECWARQGVFLLNNVLTVRRGKAASHKRQGWEQFTTAVVRELNKMDGIVFMLWGKPAQTKGKMLDRSRHLVLTSPHPSPLSAHRGYFGCKHFSKANEYLKKKGHDPIDWRIL